MTAICMEYYIEIYFNVLLQKSNHDKAIGVFSAPNSLCMLPNMQYPTLNYLLTAQRA